MQASVLPLPAGALADAQLEPFALLVAAGGPLGAHAALAAAGRRLGRPVLAATAAGYWGFLFSDAGARHEFDPVVAAARAGEGASGGGGAPAPPRARAVVAGAPLADVLAAPWTPAAPSVKATRPAAFAYVAALAAAAAGAGGGGAPPPPPYPAAGAIAAAARARADAGGAPHAGRVDDAAIGALADGLGKELAPVVAVLGGVVGDEAVKLLTRRDEPLHNVFVFDAMGGTGGNWNTFGSPAPPATIASSPAQ